MVRDLTRAFLLEKTRVEVLRGVSLRLDAGEVTAVLGRSGAGKTTLLKLLGGLDAPDGGRVTLPEGLRTAFVFQEARLMPWLTAEKNVCFGQRRSAQNLNRARAWLSRVGLAGFERAFPAQLSGGMKQRVALARALFHRADYLLMDEPFAALDPFTRAEMQRMFGQLRRQTGVGALLVTHSVDEALLLADAIHILDGGAIRASLRVEGERDLLGGDMIALKRRILERLQ